MSNYFQVLKRIEQDRSERGAAETDDTTEARFAHGDTPVTPVAASTTAAAPAAPPPIAAVPSLATRPVRVVAAAVPHGAAAAASAPSGASAPADVRASSGASAPAARAVRKAHREAPSRVTGPAPALSDEGRKGIATLFDNIRAMASGRATRTLVFAGAAVSDSVHAVTEGLAAHARQHGMQVAIAALTRTEGSSTLVRRGFAAGDAGPRETLTLDLNAGATPGELNSWIDRTAGASDLVVLEGPPLADSIDAALLACACDGLVIVADAEVTTRAALHTAAERAQIAGCRTLGVVMNGTKERMPNWMRRLVHDDDRRTPKGGE